MKTLTLLLMLALATMWTAGSCEDDADDSDDDDTGEGGDGDADGDSDADADTGTMSGDMPTDGPCAADAAMVPCDADCAFDPTTIDCAAACTTVAELCATGECTEESCAQVNQDVASCTAACEGTKTMNCLNVVFGCYGSGSDCDTVEACLAEYI